MQARTETGDAAVAVYGASGHTGAFVVAELRRRGIPTIAVGRRPAGLAGGIAARVAAIDDPAALDAALADCAVVINCAGPFLDTASPLIDAALRVACSYIDVTAEQASAQRTFADYDAAAHRAGITVIPAAGFYGGLADLLASALAGDDATDAVDTAVALDRWWPTPGTRRTGERNCVPRVVVENGSLAPIPTVPAIVDWAFGSTDGTQAVVEMPFSEIITIARHLGARRVHSYLNASALDEVSSSGTAAPTAVDALGRSAQRFVMDVVVSDRNGARRGRARGQDIYAVSAPIVVEAAARLRKPGTHRRGALSLAQAFDACEFLHALSSAVTVDFDHA
ncbi:saccharopine dehydrogenase NADP-binding domain-containing protein [Solimonas marina]|uniref:saccharopine dehydrogenase NADP-binding domain-containing protein n=1 Tax=Solimonas marina TaxID=2714601 RepID=UPI0019D28AF0